VSDLIFREYRRPDDAEDLLKVRNAIFPPLTVEEWLQDESQTASLAYMGRECVGAIPLSVRDFKLAPGVVIKAAFENAVGTREDLRSRGIGSGMIAAARDFLQDRCDALMVYRGAERSDGYRFYWKTGHRDMIYLRRVVLEHPEATDVKLDPLGLQDLYEVEDRVHKLYQDTYAEYGGHPPRYVGYWKHAYAGQIYTVIKHDTYFFRWPEGPDFQAYVIAGQRTGPRADKQLTINDLASADGDPKTMAQALRGLITFAAQQGLPVTNPISWEHPFRRVFRDLGFRESLRQTMIMAQPIRPQMIFDKLCRDKSAVADLTIKVWTPTTDFVLHEGLQPKHEITIEGKDQQIWRLLFCRLPLATAVQHDLISICGATDDIVQRLDAVWPYAPWVYHHIDYI